MHSIGLQTALVDFIEGAAGHLQAEITAGAEVPFELEQQAGRRGSSGPSLYCYRPLTGEFIIAREASLQRMPSHQEAARLLAGFDGLERLPGRRRRRDRAPGAARRRPGGAVRAAVRRLRRADRLPAAARAAARGARAPGARRRGRQRRASRSSRPCTGMTISSPEIALTKGLTIARPQALGGLPARARAAPARTARTTSSCVLDAGEEDPARAVLTRPRGAAGPAARAAPVRRRAGDTRRARLFAGRRRRVEPARAGSGGQAARHAARHGRAGGRAARVLQPGRRGGRRTATRSRGRCGASSSAASARARRRR